MMLETDLEVWKTAKALVEEHGHMGAAKALTKIDEYKRSGDQKKSDWRPRVNQMCLHV